MTPIGPDEQVDENEVMHVTDKETGETLRYRRRRLGLWSFTNHAFTNDFVQGAVRKITLVRAALGLLGVVAGMLWTIIWGSYKYVIAPQQERMIAAAVAEALAPVVNRLDRDEQLFRDHLIDVERQRNLFPTKVEQKDDMDEIKAALIRLEGRR